MRCSPMRLGSCRMSDSPLRIPNSLTLLLCRHAAITLTHDVSISSAGLFHVHEGDDLFLAGTYDGPLGPEGLKARVQLVQGNGRTRVARLPAVEMVLTPEDTSDTEVVRVPLTLQLPPVPDLSSGVYMWAVEVGGLKSKIPFLLHGSDLSSQAEPKSLSESV